MNQPLVDTRESENRGSRGPGVALVCHPHALRGPCSGAWQHAVELLRQRATIQGEVGTQPDNGNAERVSDLLKRTRPDVVVAAGGDGTVHDAVQGIVLADLPTPPALAIVPLGTGNNVARALGLASVRQHAIDAMSRAVAAIADGVERRIDLGRVECGAGIQYFVGSFAVGMDADILRMRNSVRRHMALDHRGGGYPLYLCCCAISLTRPHGARARVCVDGIAQAGRLYNALVTNTPLYAGEFRFDADDGSADGRLDLHVFTGPVDYVRGFVGAWRRHLRHTRGRAIRAASRLQHLRELVIELPAPAVWQVDGEERGAAASYRIRVVQQALTVRVARSM